MWLHLVIIFALLFFKHPQIVFFNIGGISNYEYNIVWWWRSCLSFSFLLSRSPFYYARKVTPLVFAESFSILIFTSLYLAGDDVNGGVVTFFSIIRDFTSLFGELIIILIDFNVLGVDNYTWPFIYKRPFSVWLISWFVVCSPASATPSRHRWRSSKLMERVRYSPCYQCLQFIGQYPSSHLFYLARVGSGELNSY